MDTQLNKVHVLVADLYHSLPFPGDKGTEQTDEEIRNWLYETATIRDDGYQRLTDPSLAESKMEDAKSRRQCTVFQISLSHMPCLFVALLQLDGYGKLENYVARTSRMPMPSTKRVEQIKVLEGLQPPEEIEETAIKELEEMNGSECVHRSSQRRMIGTVVITGGTTRR